MSSQVAASNGDEQVREHVMDYVHEKARDLALQGRSAREIVAQVGGGALNATERELLARIARQEVEHARRFGSRGSQRSRS
jgi:hypothetical protein